MKGISISPETNYYIWLTAVNQSAAASFGTLKSFAKVFTSKKWKIDREEVNQLSIPSSAAVPEGMKLFWHDEFNDAMLNRNKWFTQYYSNLDYVEKYNWAAFKADTLPEPGFKFTGNSLHLITNDSIPVKPYWTSGRKISSIQTYDWNSNENLLDNKRGGYFEVRVKRKAAKNAELVNTAYWFDSPGPGPRYYIEDGYKAKEVKGIRPHGQVFEIDVFENLNSEVVLHGNVDSTGKFLHNIGQFDVKDVEIIDKWVTHGLLWTPAGLKFYVNGELKKEWSDPADIKSPDHFMNLLLGSYGKNGEVDMEVDYVRGYQWPVEKGNELANSSFEFRQLFPWTGTAQLTSSIKRTGHQSLILAPGQTIAQYLYLEPETTYKLDYWSKGSGSLTARLDNLIPVSGKPEKGRQEIARARQEFSGHSMDFSTTGSNPGQMKTVRVSFSNNSSAVIIIDDIKLQKK
ncbi:glycoside hydrolase family 16 protein [Pedobacter lusitanus]|uniref:glycoside hydrolase family 16 protein n=1 Tax=Pedobacter lusitanus TaxID=1503925 RepID=UPI000B104171|nr:glycoside hydrolase family 16 protein [Pedobacter lusitanus]